MISSSHLIRFSISCLYFFTCLGPPSTTTTLTSSYSTTVPVMNNCLAFVSTLNFRAGLVKLLTLNTATLTPALVSSFNFLIIFCFFCSGVNFRSAFIFSWLASLLAIWALTWASTLVGSWMASLSSTLIMLDIFTLASSGGKMPRRILSCFSFHASRRFWRRNFFCSFFVKKTGTAVSGLASRGFSCIGCSTKLVMASSLSSLSS